MLPRHWKQIVIAAQTAVLLCLPPNLTGAQTVVVQPLHAQAHLAVTTSVPAAQRMFDHGLIMLYSFNMGQADADFAAAARLDPDCAMAYWAGALTEISDINVPASAANAQLAQMLIDRADHAREASAAERARIAALRLRFFGPGDDASHRAAYATAMQNYAVDHPNDADGWLHAAIAVWRVQAPSEHGRNADRIGADLAHAFTVDPNNFGVRHMRIHYFEEIGEPTQALADADFLAAAHYDAGESHLPHMAGHVYSHIGRFAEAAQANITALLNDRVYFARGPGAGQTYMQMYHLHVLENLEYALTTIGEFKLAERFADESGNPDIQLGVAVREHSDVAIPLDFSTLKTASVFDAAIIAERTHAWSLAAAIRAELRNSRHNAQRGDRAMLVLRAIGARARGQDARSLAYYAEVYSQMPSNYSDPPPLWEAPVAEGYGAELLRVGANAQAAKVFAGALETAPGDPHLLFGLALAEQRTHQAAAAKSAWQSYHRLWRGRRPLTLDQLG